MCQAFAKSTLPNIKDFIAEFGDSACRIQDQTGVSALALLAQIALETGWGAKVLMVHDANNNLVDSKNLGNIKVNSSWTGKTGWAMVPEFYNGQWVQSKEVFKVYDSYDGFFMDYIALISENARYSDAWNNRTDPFKYVNGLCEGGYATSPEYQKMIDSIMTYSITVDNTLPTKQITIGI